MSKGQPEGPPKTAAAAARALLERLDAQHAARARTNSVCLARHSQVHDLFAALFPQASNGGSQSSPQTATSSPTPPRLQGTSPSSASTATPKSDSHQEAAECYISTSAPLQKRQASHVSDETNAGLDFGLKSLSGTSNLPKTCSTSEALDMPTVLDDEASLAYLSQYFCQELNLDLDVELLADLALHADFDFGLDFDLDLACRNEATPDRHSSQALDGSSRSPRPLKDGLPHSSVKNESNDEQQAQQAQQVKLHEARKSLGDLQRRLQAHTKNELNNIRRA